MRVGILTGGGDCPGLNPAIRAIVRRGLKEPGTEVVGIRQGWKGLVDGDYIPLDRSVVSGLLIRGGTMLGSTPSSIFDKDVELKKLLDGYRKVVLDALIVIGGDSTLSVASRMCDAGLNVIGIPKTIDNDILGTDRTIGFNTAVTVAVEAIDRVHTTAESHNRVMIVEVMGRNAGWIAVVSGIAGGADLILVPERPFDIEEVCEAIRKRHQIRNFTIVVVAEGAHEKGGGVQTNADEKDAFGYSTIGGVGNWLKREIRNRLGFDTRTVVLGHTQRGGTPTVDDRILATRFGVKALESVLEGRFSVMVALRNDEIVVVPLREAVKNRRVDDYWHSLADIFSG
ncbi:MAG: ATP-dependent 6-phosphofructokinase [Candidatus Altiarchaeota archaeon]